MQVAVLEGFPGGLWRDVPSGQYAASWNSLEILDRVQPYGQVCDAQIAKSDYSSSSLSGFA